MLFIPSGDTGTANGEVFIVALEGCDSAGVRPGRPATLAITQPLPDIGIFDLGDRPSEFEMSASLASSNER